MKASCHCGAVELEVTLAEDIAEARRCDCSFCRRRQAANVSVQETELTVLRGADKLSLYQWNTGTAEHYFCSVCGIYTHHRRRSDSSEFGVNIGCLEGVNPKELEPLGWNDGANHPSDAGDDQ
ncbi:Gfa-like protein [Candidatus Rhodobacter oscarellae]|uniref:Gfa-like protein n=1 Tax=Candidatus Rhodobacter oscarellae TaxID=1675527 RepID=A0A0J9E6H7_9RHOB|nr:type I-B CRISPR-associated protein Cas8b1/Cst1 [Candidatus Rhodobacter lobularis]KMW58282.1 Gfa-like protein [Candidatus Rhodobacter lobularis]